jgi:hypothetical protein
MNIISIVFWILLGLFFLGVTFQYQELIIGICALVIGIAQAIPLFNRG